MFNRKMFVPVIAAALVTGVASPASAFGTPPTWVTGDTSSYDAWTVSSLASDSSVVELNEAQQFTGDLFSEESLIALDVVYSGAGNFAYGIGDNTENLYKIDLDADTMQIVWEDLGDTGDDRIDTLAMNRDVAYVTYTKANGQYAVGSINTTTGGIDFVVDIDPFLIPRSLAFFDGDLFIIDGGYGLSEEYVLKSVDLTTGQLTPLYTLDGNIYGVSDGDIDNNGIFRSLTEDNDNYTIAVNFNVLTNTVEGFAVDGIDPNPIAFWGDANEIVATRAGGNSAALPTAGLASTGVDGFATLLGFAIAALTAGILIAIQRRRSRAEAA